MSGDRNGATGSIWAPAFSNTLATRFDSGPHFGIDRQAGAGIEMQADLQTLGLERAGAPVDGGSGQAHVVARIGLGQLGQQERRIGHAARHRAHHPSEIGRIDRHPAEARLQGEDAVPGGRQAHRAANVGAEMQWAVAGRHRCTGAGARAAGIPREVPRIARQRMERASPRRQHAVVGHGGLGQDDRAGFAHPRRCRRVGSRRHQKPSPPCPTAPARPWWRCSP